MSTVNYVYPGLGTVPATGAQAAFAARQIVQVYLGTADTTITLTHNWNFDTEALARLSPQCFITPEGVEVETVAGPTARAASTITIGATVTTAGTIEIVLDRPHSIIMPNA